MDKLMVLTELDNLLYASNNTIIKQTPDSVNLFEKQKKKFLELIGIEYYTPNECGWKYSLEGDLFT